MPLRDEQDTVYPEDVRYDPDGVINPSFVEERTIRTRNLEPGITTASRTLSRSSSSLPDILNSHLPPPYEAVVDSNSRGRARHPSVSEKTCCRSCWTSVTRFKWLLWTLSLLGICCAVAGVVLGALHMTGNSFMTLSIMFIGLGVVMIMVVLVGWRCTPRGHEPCHLLFNLGEYSRTRRRRGTTSSDRGGRRREQQGRRTYWSGGIIYGDHQYRQPPPSYTAAMQDFERQLLARMNNMEPMPNSPPPTYKSQASLQRPAVGSVFPELPPSYASRQGTMRVNVERNNLNNETVRGEQILSVTNVMVHCDNISRHSADDNLSYYGPAESANANSGRGDVVERAVVHTSGRSDPRYEVILSNNNNNTTDTLGNSSGTRYGTVERSAVQFLEDSIRGGEGVINTSMVLYEEEQGANDDNRIRNGENNNSSSYSTMRQNARNNERPTNLDTAERLRVADQNLRTWIDSCHSRSARAMPGCAELRFGSARSSAQHGLVGRIVHARSSSASGVDYHEHIATLV